MDVARVLRAIFVATSAVAVLSGSHIARAVSNGDRCDSVLWLAGHDLTIEQKQSALRTWSYEQFCQGRATKTGIDWDASTSFVIDAIPIKEAMGLSSRREKAEQFCKTHSSEYDTSSKSDFLYNRVVRDSVAAWGACMALYAGGVDMSVQVGPELVLIQMHRMRDAVQFQGVHVSPKDALDCVASEDSWLGAPKEISVGRTTSVRLDNPEDFNISCERNRSQLNDGSEYVAPASVAVKTSRGSLLFKLDPDVRFSPAHASSVHQELALLRAQLTDATTCHDTGWHAVERSILTDSKGYAFDHNLGRLPRTATLWASENEDGSNAWMVDSATYRYIGGENGHTPVGAWLSDVTTEKATILSGEFFAWFDRGLGHRAHYHNYRTLESQHLPSKVFVRAVLCR